MRLHWDVGDIQDTRAEAVAAGSHYLAVGDIRVVAVVGVVAVAPAVQGRPKPADHSRCS